MKNLIPTIGAVTGLLIGMPCLNAGGPELKIERSVKVSFDSEVGKSYNAYSTTDVAKKKWELLGGPVDGTGEKIVFFYQSDDDQKVFFKVDEADGSGGGGDSAGIDHQWSDTSLRIKKANGDWGNWVDLRGPSGDRGERGPRGDAGPIGPRGDQGLTGLRGDQGAQGSAGERGPAGPQGERGIKGAIGPAGPKGSKGDSGGGTNTEKIDIAERWEQFLEENKNELSIMLVGVSPAREADLVQSFSVNDSGIMELEAASMADTTFKGEYDIDPDNPVAHTFSFKLLGKDLKYTIAYVPGVFVDNVPTSYFYGTYILIAVLDGQEPLLQRGNFWLTTKSD